MSGQIYQDILNRIEYLENIFENIETGMMNNKNPSKVLPDEEMRELDSMDSLAALTEIDSFKNEFPDTYKEYFKSFYGRYMKLLKKLEYELELMGKKPRYDRDNDIPASFCYNSGAHVALTRLYNFTLDLIKNLEKKSNTVDKEKVSKEMEPTKAQKKVEPYDRIAGSLGRLNEIFVKINHDRLNGLPFCEYPEIEEVDQFKICIDIDHFKQKYPDTYSKYLRQLLIEYFTLMTSKDYLISEYLPEFKDEYIDPYGFGKLFTAIDYVVDHLKEILKIENIHELLNPETEFQEIPHNLDKLGVIEKLLIIHYLKIESLNRYQYHLKPGVLFLSKLLDINPQSIKKPLLKLPDYVDNDKLTESQARNLYPTLEKVKSFFDESDLNEISKGIEVRINELKRKSGKD